jgi:hypothetical protein
MAFWTSLGDKSVEVHPKLSDRFLVIMGGEKETFSQNIMFTAKSVTKPVMDIETKEFKLINHKFKYPGLGTWQPIKITFVDMAGSLNRPGFDNDVTFPDFMDSNNYFNKEKRSSFRNRNFENTAAALALILYGSGYDTPRFQAAAGSSNNTGITKQHINKILQGLRIQQLDVNPGADGAPMRVVEEWQLFNPIIKSISWGELAYGEDSLVQYTLDVEYDFAEFSSGGIVAGLPEGGTGDVIDEVNDGSVLGVAEERGADTVTTNLDDPNSFT